MTQGQINKQMMNKTQFKLSMLGSNTYNEKALVMMKPIDRLVD